MTEDTTLGEIPDAVVALYENESDFRADRLRRWSHPRTRCWWVDTDLARHRAWFC